ncbi:DUF1284 domain-containing protein [archaeon]|nr:MAG: DUF1284 domain-containing protein [archaeon]
MRIRAHHLLCIQGFQGYGYSDVFIKHMATVIAQLHMNPEITITDSLDEICGACPHNDGQRCIKCGESVVRIDHTVLEMIHTSQGSSWHASDAIELTRSRFATMEDVNRVCGTCQWRKQCAFYMGIKKREEKEREKGS